jgi:hypothetical protein
MARGRMLSKKLSTSRKFAMVGKVAGEFPQLLYALLVPHSDDFGRQSGDAFTVKHEVFPTSPRSEDEFEAALVALEVQELIRRYDVGGCLVLQIVRFEDHKQGLHKRTRSEFPEPPPSVPGDSGNRRELPAQVNVSEVNVSEAKGIEPSTYGGEDAARFPQAVEKSGKASSWKRAIAIAHTVIESDPKNPHNWRADMKVRMLEQHMDPHERSPRGMDTFNDAIDFVIDVRKKRPA